MSLGPFRVSAAPDTLYAALVAEGFGPELFNPRQHECCERVEHYVLHLAADTLTALGTVPPIDGTVPVGSLASDAGIIDAFLPRLEWLLDLLAAAELIAHDADGYRLRAPLETTDLGALRAAALAVDAAYEPTYDMLDAAAALYAPVARGEAVAEAALFRRPRLWVRYFANGNPYYALSNRTAAQVAASVIPARASILEVGAGLGSSAEAFFDAVATRGGTFEHYRLTDPVAFFRRRAERTLAPPAGGVLESGDLDMNQPWEPQGVAPASLDLVWGVNAFHLAYDQAAVLAEARGALRPGGHLVLGEGLRRQRGIPEAAEFPFQLLESFHAVALDPDLRPAPGFPYPDDIMRALRGAGFIDVRIAPDPARLRAYYSGFLAGAVVARRPASDQSASVAT